ncbi:MAG: ATP-binding protein [candidate division WOR-3 bacterium]
MIEIEKELGFLLDFIPVPLIAWDKDYKILFWNGRAEQEFGKPIKEILEPTLMRELQESIKAQKEGNIEGEAFDEKEPFIIIQNIEIKPEFGSKRIYEWSSIFLNLSSQIRGLSMAKDVSKLEILQKRMLSSRRLATIGQLIGGIAHEANNLLMEVSYGINAALEYIKDPEVLEDVQLGADGVRRIKNLLKALLSNTRKIRGEKKLFNVIDVVKEVVHLGQQALSKKLTITASYFDPEPLVIGDPDQLHQVLINLLMNAKDAIGESNEGKIHFEVRNIFRLEKDEKEKEYVAISVSDNGCGMEPAVKEKIFELFFTTKTEENGDEGGSGIGLFFVNSVIRGMGGWIEVESEKDKGSKFTLFIPKS